MKRPNGRRRFLQQMGIGSLVAALAATAAETQADTPKKTFRGASKRGDIQEALNEAIAAAERSVRHPDAMVEWTLKGIVGRAGGIAGFREITVTIEGKVS